MTNDNTNNEICCLSEFNYGLNSIDTNNIVEIANCLLFECLKAYGLMGVKLFNIYLSLINPRDDNYYIVGFSKSSVEKALNLERIRPKVAKKYADSLLNPVIVPTLGDENNTIIEDKIVLFDRSTCLLAPNGQYWFFLSCSQAGKKYLFNIDGLGYIKYKLENVLKLNSKYSMALYFYIEKNSYRRSWIVDFEELKTILGCTSKTYEHFKAFNNQVLTPSSKEVNEKTDTSFEYEAIKQGPWVTQIRFIYKNNNSTYENNQKSPKYNESEYNEDLIGRIMNILKLGKESVVAIIKAAEDNGIPVEDILIYANFVASSNNINNKVGYMITIFRKKDFQEYIKDYYKNPSKYNKNSFNDFKQSMTDEKLDEIERMLIRQVNKKGDKG